MHVGICEIGRLVKSPCLTCSGFGHVSAAESAALIATVAGPKGCSNPAAGAAVEKTAVPVGLRLARGSASFL